MINKLRNSLKSKDAKTLIGNFISLSSLQVVGLLLPLITLPYIIKTISLEKYGVIVFSLALMVYFQAITDFSFRITATRDIAVFKNNIKKVSIIFSKVLIIKAIFLFISFLLISLITIFYEPLQNESLVVIFTMLSLIGNTFFPEWFFQGIEKMKYITILNLTVKILFTLLVFILIKEKSDYWLYPLLLSAGSIIAGFVGILIIVKRYKVRFYIIKKRYLIQTIRGNFPIFINQFFPTLYNNTSIFLLGVFAMPSTIGLYDALKKIIDLSIVFLNTVSRVFFPFLNRRRDAFSNYKNLMLVLSILLFVMITILNKLVIWYLNIFDDNASFILITLAFGIIGYALYDIYGLNYFIVRREDKLVMKNTIISSLVGFILSFPLVYFFGIVGAAINLTLSRFFMGGYLYIKWLDYEKN
ncbi:MAG: flippase [Pedobacter sp.]|nr:MAG: flippase [Pedobacter sp.]